MSDRFVCGDTVTQAMVALPKLPCETATMTMSILRMQADGTAIGTVVMGSSVARKIGTADVRDAARVRFYMVIYRAEPLAGALSSAFIDTRTDRVAARLRATIRA